MLGNVGIWGFGYLGAGGRVGERVGRWVAGGDIVLVGWKDVGWERRDEVEEALICVNIGGRFLSDVVHIVVARMGVCFG